MMVISKYASLNFIKHFLLNPDITTYVDAKTFLISLFVALAKAIIETLHMQILLPTFPTSCHIHVYLLILKQTLQRLGNVLICCV